MDHHPTHVVGGLTFVIRNVVPDGLAAVMANGTIVGILDLRSGEQSVLPDHQNANTYAVNQREFDRISTGTAREITA